MSLFLAFLLHSLYQDFLKLHYVIIQVHYPMVLYLLELSQKTIVVDVVPRVFIDGLRWLKKQCCCRLFQVRTRKRFVLSVVLQKALYKVLFLSF